jgi:hypothetical protein
MSVVPLQLVTAGLAGERRRKREDLRAALADGFESPIDVLRDPPAWFGTVAVGDVLCWSGVDEASCVHILDACGMNWGRRMEQLTPREVWRVFATVGLVQPLVWRSWRRTQRSEVAA